MHGLEGHLAFVVFVSVLDQSLLFECVTYFCTSADADS